MDEMDKMDTGDGSDGGETRPYNARVTSNDKAG